MHPYQKDSTQITNRGKKKGTAEEKPNAGSPRCKPGWPSTRAGGKKGKRRKTSITIEAAASQFAGKKKRGPTQ